MGPGPNRQWTERTVTNWHPARSQREGEAWLSSSQQNFRLLFKNSRKSGLTEFKQSSTETRGGSILGCSNWRILALKLLFLITGEVKTTLLVALASLDEAKLLAPPPSARLTLESARSEATVASLLAHSGALIFALWRRQLALYSALVLALRLEILLASLSAEAV